MTNSIVAFAFENFDAAKPRIIKTLRKYPNSKMIAFLTQRDINKKTELVLAYDSLQVIEHLDEETAAKITSLSIDKKTVPVLMHWDYSTSILDEVHPDDIENLPVSVVFSIAKPFDWAPEPTKKPVPRKPAKPLEKDLEADLLKWLHDRGIPADNQIATSKHRMDLWVPGKCFLELKKGKVGGDDVCQAIDYCAEYKLPVVLVGNHIGEMASRGIEAFNKAVGSDMVSFIQWSAVKTYLKGLLSL